MCQPTKLFDKILHVEVEGVNDGTSRLVVIVIDSYGGETASDLALLKHVHLDFRAKVLPQEMGCGTASYPSSDHSWRTEDQSQRQRRSVKSECGSEEKCVIKLMTINHT